MFFICYMPVIPDFGMVSRNLVIKDPYKFFPTENALKLWNMKILCGFLASLMLTVIASPADQDVRWIAADGRVHIQSDAPLEVIKADSEVLQGVIDPGSNTFAFSVRINSFQGFNSQIQRTHFLENYMEEKKYPNATFEGRFIEDIPFDTPGVYSVRAKGMLLIHGVTRERIIRGDLMIMEESVFIRTDFFVPVSDHGISIPKIVNQKIAEEIAVTIEIEFNRTQSP